jgi:hypothetical protein
MKTAGPVLILTTFLALGRAQAAPASEGKAADAADPAAKVQKMNRYAMQLFDDLNYALAEKTLLEALGIVEKSNLGGGPAGLSTNGNLAVLYSVGLRNPEKAVFHFKKALAVKPDLKMSKQRSTPETDANLARAKAELAGGATTATALKQGELAGDTAMEGPIKCPSGGEVQAGDEVTLKCLTSSELRPAAVLLYYKPNGAEQYEVLQMTKSGTSGAATMWVGKIPASQTKAKWIPVYFEARDESGTSLAFSGREDSPSVISVKGGESAPTATVAAGEGDNADGEGEEEEEGEEIDDDNPLARLEKERYREHQGSKGTFWMSLGVGAGFGYANANSTEAFGKYKVGFNSGLAPSVGHGTFEVGYFIGRKTALSLGGRFQAIIPPGPAGTATGAITGLVRLLFFSDDDGKVRWYFAGVVGAGEGFRFSVAAQVSNPDGTPTGTTVKDTVRGGPYVAGVGGGMLYKLSRHWRGSVETQGLVGFSHVSAVLDLTVGTRYQF